MVINGSSTGQLPIHLNINHEVSIIKNLICIRGENLRLCLLLSNGGRYKIKMAETSAITPPSLFGIERKIAYSHRKYHSG